MNGTKVVVDEDELSKFVVMVVWVERSLMVVIWSSEYVYAVPLIVTTVVGSVGHVYVASVVGRGFVIKGGRIVVVVPPTVILIAGG